MKDHPCFWTSRKRGWSSPELALRVANQFAQPLECCESDGSVPMQEGVGYTWKNVDDVGDGPQDIEEDGNQNDKGPNVPAKKTARGVNCGCWPMETGDG